MIGPAPPFCSRNLASGSHSPVQERDHPQYNFVATGHSDYNSIIVLQDLKSYVL